MSSVYFPAHVVVLFRRLVNVVSTLSISNHYLGGTTNSNTDTGIPGSTNSTSSGPSSYRLISDNQLKTELNLNLKKFTTLDLQYLLRDLEWPQWPPQWTSSWHRVGPRSNGENHRSWWNINRGLLVPEQDTQKDRVRMDSGILKATLDLPKWIPDNWRWPTLFSFQPGLDSPPQQPPVDGPPPKRRPSSSSSKSKEKDPRRFDFPQLPNPDENSTSKSNARSRSPDVIHQLMLNPALFDPVRTPRYPIVLCHGLYGFDSRGPITFPSMRMHYWSNVLNVLRGTVGADVIVTSVPGTGSIALRATKLDEQLRIRAGGRGVNFLAHSMGGLDCRHLISHIQPKEYVPLSLTSISTPHRGSPFMDWCATNIGIGKLRAQEQEKEEMKKKKKEKPPKYNSPLPPTSSSSPSISTSSFAQSITSLPSSFTTLLLSIVDSPAYAHLTSNYLNDVFNPSTPDDPSVKYWSVAGRMAAEDVSVWHPFWLPKMVLDGAEERERERLKNIWEKEQGENMTTGGNGNRKVPFWADERQWGNDGLVTVQSAKWGEFLGIMEGCDHWEMRGARGIEFGVDLPAIPALGLGSLPLASSMSNKRGSFSDPTPTPSSSSSALKTTTDLWRAFDGWGLTFGDWTRFVGAWKKSNALEEKERGKEKKAKEERERAGTVHKPYHHSPEETKELERKISSSSSSTASTTTSSLTSLDQTAEKELPKEEGKSENKAEKRAREQKADREKDDSIVKSSTETLSVVFDWLIDRVPVSVGSSSTTPWKGLDSTKVGTEKDELVPKNVNGDIEGTLNDVKGIAGSTGRRSEKKEITPGFNDVEKVKLSEIAAMHQVGVSSSSPSDSSSSLSPSSKTEVKSEMKRHMDLEGKARTRKRELQYKADLERFYVALARRMYEEGL